MFQSSRNMWCGCSESVCSLVQLEVVELKAKVASKHLTASQHIRAEVDWRRSLSTMTLSALHISNHQENVVITETLIFTWLSYDVCVVLQLSNPWPERNPGCHDGGCRSFNPPKIQESYLSYMSFLDINNVLVMLRVVIKKHSSLVIQSCEIKKHFFHVQTLGL